MILVLDRDPTMCARAYSDKDVVDLCSEYATYLYVAQYRLGYSGLGKPPPINVDERDLTWVGNSIHHWNWLHDLTLMLNEEYKYRFDKSEDHRAFPTIVSTFEEVQAVPGLYPNRGWVDPPNSGELSGDSVVQQSRALYRSKATELEYTKREPPRWLSS